MSARLVKADRGRAAPAGVINEKLNKLLVAKVDSAGIVPSEADGNELDRLYVALAAVSAEEHPRTARLLASSTRKVAQKVIEEAGEVALATVKHNKNGIVRESADLLYRLAVLWRRAGIALMRFGPRCAAGPTTSASPRSCRSPNDSDRMKVKRPGRYPGRLVSRKI